MRTGLKRIVGNPTLCSVTDILDIATAVSKGDYAVTSSCPTEDNVSDRILACLKHEKAYCRILDDAGASFRNICFEIQARDGATIIMPVGVYGVSTSRQAHFPLILDGLWLAVLSIDKARVSLLGGVSDSNQLDLIYFKVVRLREVLIQKIFLHYFQLGVDCCSIMGWNARGKSSLTRRVAEGLHFHRVEVGALEFYFSREASQRQIDYARECADRWQEMLAAEMVGEGDERTKFEISSELQFFARALLAA